MMKRADVVPGAVFAILLIVIILGMIFLPGVDYILKYVFMVGMWLFNVIATPAVLAVFFLGPFVGGVLAQIGVRALLKKTGSSRYWHYGFAIAVTLAGLIVWPYVVQAVAPRFEWVNWIFVRFTSGSEWTYYGQRIIYANPPIGWGVMAGGSVLLSYSVANEEPKTAK